MAIVQGVEAARQVDAPRPRGIHDDLTPRKLYGLQLVVQQQLQGVPQVLLSFLPMAAGCGLHWYLALATNLRLRI